MSGLKSGAPRWLFAVVMVGGLLACGVYLGIMRVEGVSTGNLARTVGFGIIGLAMLWGVLAKR